jgi:lathosterol oxidase
MNAISETFALSVSSFLYLYNMMQMFSSLRNLLNTFQVSFLLSVRFFLFAGSIFLFFYVWKKKKYWYLKIQQRFPDKKHIFREIRYSF